MLVCAYMRVRPFMLCVVQDRSHLCLRCWEYPELPHNLNQSHLGLHESQTHSNALPWSYSKGDVCTGVSSRPLGLVKPASEGHRGAAVATSRFRDCWTAATLPVWVECFWFGPQILPVVHPVDGGDHKGPLLDGDTLHGAVLVAAAYYPAGEWEGWGDTEDTD